MLGKLTGLWQGGGAGRRPRRAGLLAGIAALAVGAAACGGGGGMSSSGAAPSTGAPGAAPASVAVSAPFMAASSSRSFADTVAALKRSVAGAGMMVLGSLDQAKALSMTGLNLPGAQTFFVGNPTTGKMFFQTDPAVGAVLPVRMYVWQNTAGKTEIGYFDPAALLTGVDPSVGAQAKKLSMMASKITQGTTGQAPTTQGTASTRFITVDSSKSFADTVAALKRSVAGAGMMDMQELDQAKALSMTGLNLPGAQTFFVGNPTTGKMFFQTDRAAGAVVPLGFYVWQNSGGQAEIGYFDPAGLMTAVSPSLTSAGQKMSQMAATMAHGAV